MRLLLAVITCLYAVGAAHAAGDGSANDPPRVVVDWIAENAITLTAGQAPTENELSATGLDALIEALGDATVIGLGEGTHGTADFYSFKDQLLRRMTERQSLDAIFWEVDVPSIKTVRELLDQSPKMAEAASNQMRGYNWRTEEVVSHLQWLATVDSDTRPDIYGVDIFDIHGGFRLGYGELEKKNPERAAYVLAGLSRLLKTPTDDLSDKAAFTEATNALTREEFRQFGAWLDLLAESVQEVTTDLEIRLASRASKQRVDHLLQFFTLVPDKPGEPASAALGGARAMFGLAREAAETLSSFGKEVDPDTVADLSQLLEALRDPQSVTGLWSSMSRAERAGWRDALAGVSARLTVRTGLYEEAAIDPAQALSATNDVSAFLDFVHGLEATAPERGILNRREVAIARNVETLVDAYRRPAKIAMWAHNFHVNRSAGPEGRSAGALLAESMGEGFVSIGTFGGTGSFQARDLRAARDPDFGPSIRAFELEDPPPGSLEAALASASATPFALDLRKVPESGPVADWFRQARPTRHIGNQYDPEKPDRFFFEVVPGDHFDIVVFFPTTRRAKPTAASRDAYSFDVGVE